jgi:hypothetical protein
LTGRKQEEDMVVENAEVKKKGLNTRWLKTGKVNMGIEMYGNRIKIVD